MNKNSHNSPQLTRKETRLSNLYLIYYVVLGVIQSLWISRSSFPPLVLRLGMSLMVFGPLLFKKELIPFAFVFSITLRQHLSTEYSYLPNIYSVNVYLLILVLLSVVHYDVWKRFNFKTSGVLTFAAIIFIWTVSDLINKGSIGNGACFLLIAFFLLPFLADRKAVEYVIGAYIFVSMILAIYYFFMYDSFAVTWNVNEDIERSGWSDPNYFSIHIGIGFMMSMACLFGIINTVFVKYHRVLLIAGAFIIFFAIMMTGSRAGLLSSFVITLLVIVLSKNKAQYKLVPIIVLPVILFILFKSRYAQLVVYRFFSEDTLSSGGGRLEIWSMALENYIQQDIWHLLFGGGWWHRANLTAGSETHNEWLAQLCDYGLIGLFLTIALYVKIVFNKAYQGLTSRLFITFVYYLLMMVSLSPSQYPIMPMYTSWLIMSYLLHDDSDRRLQIKVVR